MNQAPKISLKKKILGVTLIVIGFLALVTPLTPGAWFLFVGLEMIGVRVFFGRSIKEWLEYFKEKVQKNET